MPLDPAIKKVLVIGAGPIIIGQGCEFDYSGTQACKALKEEGCEVILLNSNPATIMTDSDSADHIYIEPMNSQTIEEIIHTHRPDSLLPIVGGQTALNCAKEVSSLGILEKYGVNLIGLTLETIEKAENRERFKKQMREIGLEVPLSCYATNWQEVLSAQKNIGFPLVVRCSFTLGGDGGGIAYDLQELKEICEHAFSISQGLLIERAIINWKEYELEVMRDRNGNCIVVCGIENIDPMGVHTGDSITVTPIQTLTDKEYQIMRKCSFQVLEAIGMTSGGCNVQFAIHPQTGELFCIEVNPRVSRSSALASKATGFPIAKIATKLALGYTLDELRATYFSASFEPVIDYVVTKIPRFDFDKFPKADKRLTTRMKSTGEVMAIGRTFKESLNKAISSLDAPFAGVVETIPITEALKIPFPGHLSLAHKALGQGMAVDEVHRLTGYDPWFLGQISDLVNEEKTISESEVNDLSVEQLLCWKRMGFSDKSLAFFLKCEEEEIAETRRKLNIHPVYKRVDSCSAEFSNNIACMYSTYGEECESYPTLKPKILVLGSGPNRIGQGIEFDHCCVHAVKAIRKLGYESIMLNCNPETVSTDYDMADRLYFEPLTPEHVLEVIMREKPIGTMIQFGGQTSLNIGKHLHRKGFPILGTPLSSIDITEDRNKFRVFAEKIGLRQPKNDSFSSSAEALKLADQLGFPLICRPSYVIGGNAMQIVYNINELKTYLQHIPIEAIGPILIEEFLEGAMEVEIDAISDGKEVFICGIIEHIEPAGVHSGDSRSFLSPYNLSNHLQELLVKQTKKIGHSLNVIGLFNIQFAIRDGVVTVIEVNLRASRTVPLLSKTTRLPLAQIATKCILGISLSEQGIGDYVVPQTLGLKLPVFPFSNLHVKDIHLGPQMKSTGEVLCMGKTYEELFHKARLYGDVNSYIIPVRI